MNTRRGGTRRHVPEVDDKVANAPEEVVLVDIPAFAVLRRVGVDDSHASKVGGSEKGRRVGRITNELGVVVGNDGGRDDVGTRGGVNILCRY